MNIYERWKWEPPGEAARRARRIEALRVPVRYLTDEEIAAASRAWARLGKK